MFKAKIFTLYPEYFPGPFNIGICKKAFEKKLWDLKLINIRDYADDKHKTVDDTPYGGGEGMLIGIEPLEKSLHSIESPGHVINLSPQGTLFNQNKAIELSSFKNITFICGRYEGIDQRFIDRHVDEELSIGDYVLSGGEIAASVVIDAILRNIPGVIGNKDSKGVTGIKIKNIKTNKTSEINIHGLFIAIGHDPATSLFKGQLDMDKEGYLITKPDSTETNKPGVFAAGDVKDKVFRQAVTAAGMGCMSALEAENYLTQKKII